MTFSQHTLSNLLGGLGYFYGRSKVDESHAPEYEEKEQKFWDKAAEARHRAEAKSKGPYELFTHVPSRAAFPRGFLWDEGFHLLPVVDWDLDLAMEVLQSWLALMDDDGWIAREQILGAEARSKVPENFQIQQPHVANPPTPFWAVSRFVDMLAGKATYSGRESEYLTEPGAGNRLLEFIYPLLKRHYEWFRKTQSGDVEAHSIPLASLGEGYRWRGRTPGYTYASGLDDFPRAEPPDITELHVDAICWVGVMAEVLSKIAVHLRIEQDHATYERQRKAIAQNLEVLHWSENAETYCDTRVWDDAHTFTCPKGYISLFPFMTGFLGPNHQHLNATLNLLTNSTHLWTPYGIRSLSPESTHYGTDDNYWRSPIWININYMIIEQLLYLARTPGPLQKRCRAIYRELRENVVQTVFNSWQKTGFVWEQYNPDTGTGQRTQHFTGWTSLVVKIMAFPDLEGEGEDGYREKIGALVQEAKENRGWSAGAILAFVMIIIFVYVMRRRFRGTVRSITRRI
jgi:mannosyl-oligosaccharide glucosidase